MTRSKAQAGQFLVRVWWETDVPSKESTLWRGYVRHIPSGEAVYVRTLEDLVAFIERWTGPLSASPPIDGKPPTPC